MTKTLYLMCGVPGGGKSTIARSMAEDLRTEGRTAIVSRDEIRFAMLKDGDDYFKYEDKVFDMFINRINDLLDSDEVPNIFIDATHLNEKARNKVLDRLHLNDDVWIIPVDVRPSLERCIEQNNRRSGLAHVPESVIRKMYDSYERPTYHEKYFYHMIIVRV